MKNLLKNPWFYLLLWSLACLFFLTWFVTAQVKKIIKSFNDAETKLELKTEDNQAVEAKKTKNAYYSEGYSINGKNEEKIITTAGVIYILENGNVIHLTMTGENVNGRMKETEKTVVFLIEHQEEIFDELIKTIVEAGQRSPKPEPKKESPFQNNKAIKKKV